MLKQGIGASLLLHLHMSFERAWRRFGMMASQMKAFFDTTGGLWQKGALHGKPASFFTSTASQNGGQETTIMTAVTQLTHHGMVSWGTLRRTACNAPACRHTAAEHA
jgi:hypothetical protein